MIDRPEKDWTYNFQTTGVALLKGREELVTFDVDGYVTKISYAGDKCYEWDMFQKFKASSKRGTSIGRQPRPRLRPAMTPKSMRWRLQRMGHPVRHPGC